MKDILCPWHLPVSLCCLATTRQTVLPCHDFLPHSETIEPDKPWTEASEARKQNILPSRMFLSGMHHSDVLTWSSISEGQGLALALDCFSVGRVLRMYTASPDMKRSPGSEHGCICVSLCFSLMMPPGVNHRAPPVTSSNILHFLQVSSRNITVWLSSHSLRHVNI